MKYAVFELRHRPCRRKAMAEHGKAMDAHGSKHFNKFSITP